MVQWREQKISSSIHSQKSSSQSFMYVSVLSLLTKKVPSYIISSRKTSAFQTFRIFFSTPRTKVLLICILWLPFICLSVRMHFLTFSISYQRENQISSCFLLISLSFSWYCIPPGISYLLLVWRKHLCHGISKLFLCCISRSIFQC